MITLEAALHSGYRNVSQDEHAPHIGRKKLRKMFLPVVLRQRVALMVVEDAVRCLEQVARLAALAQPGH